MGSSALFKENLLRLMKTSRLTITQGAQRAGLLPQNFSKYLKGQLVPNLTTLDKLAKAFDVPPSTLVDENFGLAHVAQSEMSKTFESAIRNFVTFKGLTHEEGQELSLAVTRFGGWKPLLEFLREELELRARGEEFYQSTKEEITRVLQNRAIKETRRKDGKD